MNKEEFIDSNMKLSKEDIIYNYYETEEKLIEKLGIEHELYELKQRCKKQKEVINKITDLIKQYGKYDGEKCTRGFQMWSADFNKILDMLKEVSK